VQFTEVHTSRRTGARSRWLIGSALLAFSLPFVVLTLPKVFQAGASVPGSPPNPTVLSPEDAARVVTIAQSDERVKQLQQGQPATVSKVTAWWDEYTGTQIGGAVLLTVPSPVSVPDGLPQVKVLPPDQVQPGQRPYKRTASPYPVDNVTGLWVFVDITTDELVRIVPDLGSHTRYPPGYQPTPTAH